MTWAPEQGFIPRGYFGALGSIEEVELILITAEPGDPYPRQQYSYKTQAMDVMDKLCKETYEYISQPPDQFHRNLRKLLDICWPRLNFHEQMKKTWITDSVMCSAVNEGASVPKDICLLCGNSYLKKQLSLMQNKKIIVLGGKATKRLKWLDIKYDLQVFSIAPPGCNFKGAVESWHKIPDSGITGRCLN